jgi:hypothetical protein
MWQFDTAGFSSYGGGLVTKSGKIWTWCDNVNVCPGQSQPTAVALSDPVVHAIGLSKSSFYHVIFVLQNGTAGLFGDPIPTYQTDDPGVIVSTQPATPTNPVWLNMTGTPSANITKIVSTGGGYWGGIAFLFSSYHFFLQSDCFALT